MKPLRILGLASFVLAVAGVGAVLVLVGPRWYAARQVGVQRQTRPATETPTRKIKATLFYVSEDGERLVPVEREVAYGGEVLDQAKRIVEAEIAAAPSPLISPMPAGTKLRAIYMGRNGEAYVDLSREASAAHPGGSLNELLTVYAIVDGLTANLPAIRSVQLLVDGREVDTLAGHVDLRRPLTKSGRWVQERPTTND